MNPAILTEPEHSFLDTLKNCAALFVRLSPALMIAFFAARILEFMAISRASNLPVDFLKVIGLALLFDMVSLLKILPFLFVLYLPVCFSARTIRMRYRLYGAVGSVVILLYAVLIKYFATATVPLGSDVFGYSLKEIQTTISGGLTIDPISILLFVIPVSIFWVSLKVLSFRSSLQPVYAFAVLGAGVVLTFTVSGLPARPLFASELSYHMAVNKIMYFAGESYAYFSGAANGIDDTPVTRKGGRRSGTSVGSNYLDPEYPFLRTDEARDVLGEFFNGDPSKQPNLVFILVEGLGKAFSGPHAYLGSFTPFLDELAGKSLYWENFLASQGRTFAALPSILASLPFAEQGFNELGNRMPNHLSLMSVLKHNGYRLKFYIGSDPDFDNERLFLQRQGVDVLVGIDDYETTYTKSPGSSWGYPDREVMRKAVEMDRQDSRQPYLSFVQTMSMHTSYTIPDQAEFLKRFEDRMEQLGFDKAQKERHRTNEKIYSTIMYTDDALRFFFEQYAKLPAYGNTIFIITGDHRLPEIEMSTKIDRFHVPLIIFSPLLKHAAHFESISSQLDITPSFLAFFKKKYSLDVPTTVSWIGTGLDTDPSFRNIHRYPLKHTKTNLIDYISGMYFIDQDVLFSIGRYMDLEPIQDEKKRDELIAEFNQYKSMNDRFIHELKLIPDSLYEHYHR